MRKARDYALLDFCNDEIRNKGINYEDRICKMIDYWRQLEIEEGALKIYYDCTYDIAVKKGVEGKLFLAGFPGFL